MAHQRYDDEILRRLRNDIPIAELIRHLGWPSKIRDGRFYFRRAPRRNHRPADLPLECMVRRGTNSINPSLVRRGTYSS